MQASTQETRYVPEVWAHHQGVPTSLLRSPQRAGSLSTLILSQINHKGLEMGCSLTLLNERIIQTSRRSHTSSVAERIALFARPTMSAERSTSSSIRSGYPTMVKALSTTPST